MPLLGVNLPQLINAALGPLLLDATLTRTTSGNRTAGHLGGGTNPTTATYAAKGFIEDYLDHELAGSIVKAGDRKVTLLGASIASAQIPMPNDMVTIESTAYRVIAVKRDPAAATYECQARR